MLKSLFAMLLLLAMASACVAKAGASAGFVRVIGVVNSSEYSKEQKVSRLKELTGLDETRAAAYSELEKLDFYGAMQTALTAYHSKDTSHSVKLSLGHFILEKERYVKVARAKDFPAEFAQYLIASILNDGEKEFFNTLEEGFPTAVGEYAYLASDFAGYAKLDFSVFKDTRVVPVLIRCLDAPDNVYPKLAQGCIHGKPGQSTGRNTARQQIPIALGKLGDTRAVEPLKRVLFNTADINHTDFYERMNAAYALTRLLKQKKDRDAVGKTLYESPQLFICWLPFGKGLIEAGDDAGVKFLSIKHESAYSLSFPNVILGKINERMRILKGFRTKHSEEIIREALACKPLRSLLLFEPDSAKVTMKYMDPKPPKSEAEALERIAPQIIATYAGILECIADNKFKDLSSELQEIGTKTRNEKIRQMTTDAIKSLNE